MSRLALLMLSTLAVWAGWFVAAYALHGVQCSGGWPLSRGGGQALQVALWLLALAVVVVLERWLRRDIEGTDATDPFVRGARAARAIGALAAAFIGWPVLVLAPC